MSHTTSQPEESLSNDPRIEARLFAAAWRIAWQQFSQQYRVLESLFNAARDAADAQPRLPELPARELTDEEALALRHFFDEDGKARGARDAYATAIVMFVDDSFTMLSKYYDRIPGISHDLRVCVEDIDVPRIFDATANQVRHYLDWRVPPQQLSRPDLAVANASVVAKLMGRPIPTAENVSVWATNWAWPVIAKVSGDRTFAGFMLAIVATLDELLANAGETANDYVVADRDRFPIPPHIERQ